MIESSFIVSAVENQYGVTPTAILPLHQYFFDWRGIYRIDDVDGQAWVLRLIRQDEPTPWLLKPAAILRWFELCHYRAPHVLPTRTHSLVGSYEGWSMLMLRFIDGSIVDPTPATLSLIGGVLGQLHALKYPLDRAEAELPFSWWHPMHVFPTVLEQLTELKVNLPRALHPIHEALCATLRNVQQNAKDLPQSIIHGDCWYANAVLTPDNCVVFIDWDCAGLGPAILDLGNLLLTSHYDLAYPNHIQPDAMRIDAIIRAYSQHRVVTETERRRLLDAIRFGLAFHGNRYLQQIEGNWRENLRIQKLQTRFAATEAIAELALTSLATTMC